MEIRYTPTFADYLALNVYVLRKGLKKLPWLAAGLFVVFLLSPITLHSVLQHAPDAPLTTLDYYRKGSWVLILPGIVVLAFVGVYFGARKNWANSEGVKQDRIFEINESGIRVRARSFEGFMEWQLIKEATITEQFVYLKLAGPSFHYFPVFSRSRHDWIARVDRKSSEWTGDKLIPKHFDLHQAKARLKHNGNLDSE